MRHMRRLFGALQSRGATTFEVTDDASKRFLQDAATSGEFGVRARRLRLVAVVLVQPQR